MIENDEITQAGAVRYKRPLVHNRPTFCSGDGCSLKDQCVRVKRKGLFSGINVYVCTRQNHCFQLAEGTPEAEEFKRQLGLYHKEMKPFTLRAGYKIPTNNSMYDCGFCKESGTPHTIEERPTPDYMKLDWVSYERFFWPSTIRVCSGCNRFDGPWVPYGDD